MDEKDILKEKLIEVAASGLGCLLIKRNVIEKIKFRYDKRFEGFDDEKT